MMVAGRVFQGIYTGSRCTPLNDFGDYFWFESFAQLMLGNKVMTWKTATIKLAPARTIFEGCSIREIKIGEKTVGYEAFYRGGKVEDSSLTELCKRLWKLANLEQS